MAMNRESRLIEGIIYNTPPASKKQIKEITDRILASKTNRLAKEDRAELHDHCEDLITFMTTGKIFGGQYTDEQISFVQDVARDL